jgi:hypothetical protein
MKKENQWYLIVFVFFFTDFLLLFQLFFQILSVSCLVLASYKFRGFVVAQGATLNLPQSTLAIEIITALLRIIFFVDPEFSWGFFSNALSIWLETVTWPFALMTSFLVAAFWYEMLNRVVHEASSETWLSVRIIFPTFSFFLSFFLFALTSLSCS